MGFRRSVLRAREVAAKKLYEKQMKAIKRARAEAKARAALAEAVVKGGK